MGGASRPRPMFPSEEWRLALAAQCRAERRHILRFRRGLRHVRLARRHRVADGRRFRRERPLVGTAALFQPAADAQALPLAVLPPRVEVAVELLLPLAAIILIVAVERLHLAVAPA